MSYAVRKLWAPAAVCTVLLALEIALLIFDTGPRSGRRTVASAPLATYLGGSREVRQKPGGTLVWEAPSEGQRIFGGDSVATMDGSEAIVRFEDQSEIVVEPNSLIVFEVAPAARDASPGAPADPDRKRAPVVARLVKGSLARRKAAPAGAAPLLIRFSRDPEAPPVELKEKGGAIFRVVHRDSSAGLEIVVEAGALDLGTQSVAAGQSTEVAPDGSVKAPAASAEPKPLPAPRIRQPRIEVLPEENEPSAWHRVLDWLMPSAQAAPSRKVSVNFGWEAIEGAKKYRVQVSRDSSFSKPELDQVVEGTSFDYRTTAPSSRQELFFRVAGVSEAGNSGDFSQVERIEIKPVPVVAAAKPKPKPSPEPAPSPTVAPTVAAKPPAPKPSTVREPTPAPAPNPVSVAVSEPVPSSRIAAELRYTALYHSRSFKASSEIPAALAGSASGIVPARLSGELGLRFESYSLRLEASRLFESARADSTALVGKKVDAGVTDGSFVIAHRFGGVELAAGPSLTTITHLKVESLALASERAYAMGLSFQARPARESGWLLWRARADAFAAGSPGISLGAELLHPIGARALVTSELGWRSLADESGLFAGLGLGLRL